MSDKDVCEEPNEHSPVNDLLDEFPKMMETMEKAMSGFFRNLKTVLDDVNSEEVSGNVNTFEQEVNTADEKVENIFTKAFGGDTWNKVQKEVEINLFFQECLKSGPISEAKLLTKEKFDLPDDYTMKVQFEVDFLTL